MCVNYILKSETVHFWTDDHNTFKYIYDNSQVCLLFTVTTFVILYVRVYLYHDKFKGFGYILKVHVIYFDNKLNKSFLNMLPIFVI